MKPEQCEYSPQGDEFLHFLDYTIMHRFRGYEDDRSANSNIFEYITSSNNRDGLALKAAGHELLNRDEEHKVLIVLSDGRPYDVILNRPNARNPQPYQGKYAISDTASRCGDCGIRVCVSWGYLQVRRRICRRRRKSSGRILPISTM